MTTTHDTQTRKGTHSKKCIPFFHLHAHAGSHPEGGGDGGKYGDNDVQDLAPDVLVFHF